jgi:hypothetical protein
MASPGEVELARKLQLRVPAAAGTCGLPGAAFLRVAFLRQRSQGRSFRLWDARTGCRARRTR